MAEDINIIEGSKEAQYRSIIPQISALLDGEPDLIANLANVAAALKQQFSWFWVGFYLVKSEELVLGPFQGPVACTRIRKGRGVCGSSWEQARTLIVPDVTLFPGHIACSSLSKSEIVIPLIKNGTVMGVLDIDSELPDQFDETDQQYLEEIIKLIDINNFWGKYSNTGKDFVESGHEKPVIDFNAWQAVMFHNLLTFLNGYLPYVLFS